MYESGEFAMVEVVSYCDSKCGCDAWVKLVLVSGCCKVDTGISRKLRGPGRTGSRSKGALELSISRWNRSVCWLCVSSCCLKNIAKYHSKILFFTSSCLCNKYRNSANVFCSSSMSAKAERLKALLFAGLEP